MKKAMVGVLALAAACAAQQQVIEQREIRVEKLSAGNPAIPGGSLLVGAGMIGADGHMGLLNVTDRPFSATEERRTVQMLANGAKIESGDSNRLYRDSQGRTRAEQTLNGRTTVVIMDPVGRFVAMLDPAVKTMRKTPIPAGVAKGAVSVSEGKVMVLMGTSSGSGLTSGVTQLGEKVVNGVLAQGSRETRTIPAGAIGNDRALELVDERWFSSDQQVLMKSISSDPRFGETTYQLTNFQPGPQDPALFQVPADYKVADPLK